MSEGFVEIFVFFIYPFIKIYDLWLAGLILLKPSGLFPSIIVVLLTLAIIFGMLYSACICSGLAERKLRDPLKHFILGFVLPYIHVGTLKILPTREEAFAELVEFRAEREGKLKSELTNKFADRSEYEWQDPEDVAEDKVEEVVEEVVYDRDFFESLIFSEWGYSAILKNGRIIEIEAISEIGDDYIMVDVLNMNKELQRLRLVYRMIDVFTIREEIS